MKHSFIKLACAILAGFAFTSCFFSKEDPVGSTLPSPSNENYSLSVDVQNSNTALTVPLPDGTEGLIKHIDIPASGNKGNMLVIEKTKDKPISLKDDVKTIEFRFTVDPNTKVVSGIQYSISNYGNLKLVEVVGGNVEMSLTKQDGQAYPLSGTLEPNVKNSEKVAGLFRSWNTDETVISVTGAGLDASLGVAKVFQGCSPSDIVEYVNGKGLDLDVPSGNYDITQFSFEASGHVTLYFAGHAPISGDLTVSDASVVSMFFNAPSTDNPLLGTTATGGFSVVDGRGRLTIDTNYKSGDKDYKVHIIFWLKPVA